MAVAQGNCPGCGAPIQFSVGASIAKVCDYCRTTVYRTDRGLQNLGKAADLANVPSLIAIGDHGTLGGRPFEVLGRVQLDHGKGPWDEYYVTFEHGNAWGWLAYAQGQWFVTEQWTQPPPIPPFASLKPEMDIPLGQVGNLRVAEVKTGRIVSAEGELPEAHPTGFIRHYADLRGKQNVFATFDYGDNTGGYWVYLGRWFDEREMKVTEVGPRTAQKVKLDQIRCPNCGGDVPKHSGERSKRLGCPYCGAVSDIASQQVIAQQEAAMKTPDIPIGTRGTLDQIDYVCIAYVQRSSLFEGERFSWDEYLLFSEGLGYRWLVKDEASWMWVMPVNLADLELSGMPGQVGWNGETYYARNLSTARVDYVLGEVFWQCEVGEQTRTSDYVSGSAVLSREESPGEVQWSYSAALPWAVIAQAFGLPEDSPAGRFHTSSYDSSSGASNFGSSVSQLITLAVILVVCVSLFNGGCGIIPIPVVGGSGFYYGGK